MDWNKRNHRPFTLAYNDVKYKTKLKSWQTKEDAEEKSVELAFIKIQKDVEKKAGDQDTQGQPEVESGFRDYVH